MNQRNSTIELSTLFNLKSDRVELQGKASRKSDMDKIVFNQRYPNGQIIHAWKPKTYSKKTFGQKNKKVFTLSDDYYQQQQTLFRFHFKQYWHFYWVTPKQNYTLFQTSNNTDIFRELLVNNTTRFSIVYIKQYWHFQRVSSKLTIVKNFFRVYISHNNHTFRALLSNNVGLFRTHIKQYSHFHRVITKQ